MKRRNSQAGNGSLGIILYVMGASILWIVALFVRNWIFETKEARIDRAYEAGAKLHAHKKYVARGYFDPGNYDVHCGGFLIKSCSISHTRSQT